MSEKDTSVTTRSPGLNRRGLLGAAAAATGAALLTAAPASAAPSTRSRSPQWPHDRLTAAATRQVDPTQFISRRQIHAWQEGLDDIGLRATGSRSHHAYVDRLAERMQRVGIRHVHADPVPLKHWAPSSWHLDVVGGQDAGKVKVSWYVPYSGNTGPEAITARLSLLPMKDTIGLVSVSPPSLPYALMDLVDWDAPLQPHHPAGYNPLATYDRAWFAGSSVAGQLDRFKKAGALGVVIVLNLPEEAARGQYLPYDGIHRELPSLIVDRDTGKQLTKVALRGGTVRLRLQARVKQITTPNLYGIIPGASDELVMIQSHTDGTNGLEENGPEAILAMAQYLARIPRRELPRSILIVMSTGHMSGHAMGTEAFLRRHTDGLVARTAAAMSLEHLGARPWLPDEHGEFRLADGYETALCFSSPHREMIKVARRAQERSQLDGNRVLRPFMPDTISGESPNGYWWPGDGEGLWRVSALPSMQYISGPTYLLSSGMPVMDFIDTAAIRRQAIAFTDAALELARIPRAELNKRRPDDPANIPTLPL
ncbi:hypothetical protein ACIGBL_01750 [Streptomyces sp. NPDC085614]|uniref:hypothetical protein n=1 Tax=Streptomyces sp. NPDC085614 TaxID=3365733 RepID=UPI0037CD89AD